MPKPIVVLNGPNLNMLGARESSVYGAETLRDARRHTEARGVEGELVGWFQEVRDKASGIILNAAERPAVGLHLSNVFRREGFCHHSYLSPAAQGAICGFGPKGYELAVEAMADSLAKPAVGGKSAKS